jgi:hypothetical protein
VFREYDIESGFGSWKMGIPVIEKFKKNLRKIKYLVPRFKGIGQTTMRTHYTGLYHSNDTICILIGSGLGYLSLRASISPVSDILYSGFKDRQAYSISSTSLDDLVLSCFNPSLV